MGLLSKLKNSLTGGWAEVHLEAGPGVRGEDLTVVVHVRVKGEPIEPSRIYCKLRCSEVVDIPNYRSHDRDDVGDVDSIDVRKREELYEREFEVAGPQQLEAESSHRFELTIPLPGDQPSAFRGRWCGVEWELFVGLDMKGNDPDSGWQELSVR